eukprot:scaffold56716_cov35-Tisochrysis_lutea.AAC.1
MPCRMRIAAAWGPNICKSGCVGHRRLTSSGPSLAALWSECEQQFGPPQYDTPKISGSHHRVLRDRMAIVPGCRDVQ